MQTIATNSQLEKMVHATIERNGVPLWRIVRTPASGKIKWTGQWNGIEVCIFENERGTDEIRVLIPEPMIAVREIKLIRAEGPIALCGKEEICKREIRKGDGSDGLFGKDWEVSPFSAANAVIQFKWGNSAPKQGYDKVDFWITWEDDTVYKGRFDMQYGGLNGGDNFHDSFMGRIRWYAGLSPVSLLLRQSGIQATENEARERYKSTLSHDHLEFCRKLLAHYEL